MAGCLLAAGLTGCESFQRKFVRKKKNERPPTPVISFHDYSGAMTPLERYRKHYMMFEYWNADVLEALQGGAPNPKRYRQSSGEALVELQTMQSLLDDEVAARLAPLIAQREKFDQQLRTVTFNASRAFLIVRVLETQTRQIHRDFFWRTVQDRLKPAPAPPAPAADAPQEDATHD